MLNNLSALRLMGRFLCLLAALLLPGCQSTPSPSRSNSPDSAPAPIRIRVMTWNIHHGEGMDRRLDLNRIAALIRESGADVVALQEVDRGVNRTQQRDLPAELAALTGLTCLFSNNHHFGGGDYGNALLTRFPLRHWTNAHYRMLTPVEQRGIMQAELDIHGRALLVANTHLDAQSGHAERLNEAKQILELLGDAQGRPRVIFGDFNTVPGSEVYRELSRGFQDAWMGRGEGAGATVPVRFPTRRIDYIWLENGWPWKVDSIQVLESDASDHLPVVATLSLP